MAGRAFATPEGPVAVQGAPEELIEAFRELAPDWPENAAEGGIGTVSVTAEAAGLRMTSTGYDTPDFLFEPGLGAGNGLAGCLIHTFVAASPDWIALHAAAVEVEGELLVLAGDMMAGKSTLTLALSALGGRIWCDDRLPVRQTAGGHEGMALGLRPKLRWPMPVSAPEAFRGHVAARRGPVEGAMRLIVPRPGEQAAFDARLPVGRLILLDRQDGVGAPAFSALPLGDAVRRLVPCAFAPHLGPAGLLARLRSLVEGASCDLMTYEDTFDAAALLSGRAWP